ncbi:MAG: cycloisomaltooligosaccharide glucanotransferase, partial [Lentimicrobium sp.]|nr:cycloisomaltooligosaccharide glucanotransferase [Lentimicrobium sp.]
MKKFSNFFSLTLFLLLLVSCDKKNGDNDDPPVPVVTKVSLFTDKSCYKPGETVIFTADKSLLSEIKVRYRHLNFILDEKTPDGNTWSWTPPATDFTGYLAEVFTIKNGTETLQGSIAVDVSSDWNRFPRYGFLSGFPEMTSGSIDYVISNLSRYHINGLQFYDWHCDHHKPLAGTVDNPAPVWKDIANRDTYLATVQSYIETAHSFNMKAMFYNLAYGALSNASADGVSDQWYLFTDQNHTWKDYLHLSSPMFKSDIYLTDPSNTEWQQYIGSRNRDVYEVFDFDGYHIDQLGIRDRTLYDYSGQTVDLPVAYTEFINAMKADMPDKKLIMNAVNQYGQQNIASTPVDFLYTEVWGPNDDFEDLARIINDNNAFSNNSKSTVLAAYVNYDLANASGYFNTPGVLLTNSVIFAFGGSHLELGEHMLAKEYFPNNNLQISGQLRDALIAYYDFLVAYQNLLRDGGQINSPDLSCTNAEISMVQWPPQSGKVAFS